LEDPKVTEDHHRRGGRVFFESTESLELQAVPKEPLKSAMKVATLEDSLRSTARPEGLMTKGMRSISKLFRGEEEKNAHELTATGKNVVVENKKDTEEKGMEVTMVTKDGTETLKVIPESSDNDAHQQEVEKEANVDEKKEVEKEANVDEKEEKPHESIEQDKVDEKQDKVEDKAEGKAEPIAEEDKPQANKILEEDVEDVKKVQDHEPTVVQFHMVFIREYKVEAVDNPGVSRGPGVGIGWEYQTMEPIPVDDFEEAHPQPRRRLREFKMSMKARMDLLAASGVPKSEVDRTIKRIAIAKKKRQITLNQRSYQEQMQMKVQNWNRLLRVRLGLAPKEDQEEDALWDKAQQTTHHQSPAARIRKIIKPLTSHHP